MKKNVFTTFSFLMIYIVCQAQYDKPKDCLRFMTYNVAFCRGFDAFQDGSKENKNNTLRIGKIVKALDPDIVAFQELDSGNINNRFLLQDIQKASGIDYQVIYGTSDKADVGNYGVGILVKKGIKVTGIKKIRLPGTLYGSNPPIKNNDRLLFRITTDRFYFMCTHLDLNDEQRINSAAIINSELDYMPKPSFLVGDLNDSHRWQGGAFANFFNGVWDIFSTLDFTCSNPKNKSTIDYILYYNYLEKNEYSVISTHAIRGMLNIPGESNPVQVEYASDHLPVIVDIKDNISSGTKQTQADMINIYQQNETLRINGLNNSICSCSIFTETGAWVYSDTMVNNAKPISIENLAKGVYILKITCGKQNLKNYKFIKS